MSRKIEFTPIADQQLSALEANPAKAAILKQVQKALGYLEANPRHPSLNTHEFTAFSGLNGEKVFEAYAQNNTPGAYRIFWHYGPDEVAGKKRVAVITIVAITPHPLKLVSRRGLEPRCLATQASETTDATAVQK